ncbi:MAG: hypothetical protein ACI8YI_001798 [Paracoccaceae bacterium]|jgi:hypothetical protein
MSSTGRRNALVFLKDGVLVGKYRLRTVFADKQKSGMTG